jgi:hypothetical protein
MPHRRRKECLHGTPVGCPECLHDDLAEFLRELEEPETAEVLDAEHILLLKTYSSVVRSSLARRIASEAHIHPDVDQPMNMEGEEFLRGDGSVYESVDEDQVSGRRTHASADSSEFHSPKNAPSPRSTQHPRFYPHVHSGSAFGAVIRHPRRSTTPPPDPTHPGAPYVGVRTSSWTNQEVSDLRDAVARFQTRWESIRKNYPSLNRFTGTQLKDKWRLVKDHPLTESPPPTKTIRVE